MNTKTFTIRGVEMKFVRRRYGKRTFTWLHFKDENDQWVDYGDPWPCITPSRRDLDKAVDAILAKYPLPSDYNKPMCSYRETVGEHWYCVRPAGHRGDHSPFVVDADNADSLPEVTR